MSINTLIFLKSQILNACQRDPTPQVDYRFVLVLCCPTVWLAFPESRGRSMVTLSLWFPSAFNMNWRHYLVWWLWVLMFSFHSTVEKVYESSEQFSVSILLQIMIIVNSVAFEQCALLTLWSSFHGWEVEMVSAYRPCNKARVLSTWKGDRRLQNIRMKTIKICGMMALEHVSVICFPWGFWGASIVSVWQKIAWWSLNMVWLKFGFQGILEDVFLKRNWNYWASD